MVDKIYIIKNGKRYLKAWIRAKDEGKTKGAYREIYNGAKRREDYETLKFFEKYQGVLFVREDFIPGKYESTAELEKAYYAHIEAFNDDENALADALGAMFTKNLKVYFKKFFLSNDLLNKNILRLFKQLDKKDKNASFKNA